MTLEANVANLAHAITIDHSKLSPYLREEVSSFVKSAGAYADEVAELMHAGRLEGDTLPWAKTHGDFRMRSGEVTVWHGINGHAKSAVLGQVVLWLALHGVRSCIASFEMAPKRTVYRMLLQAAGNPAPTNEIFARFMFLATKTIRIFDKRGRVELRYLFAAIRYCAEHGVKHFVVDSLMKCVPGPEDYNGQADFVNSLCDIAHETGTHIHLVHHCKKGDNEDKLPNKFDAKGSGSITDQADNVIAVWRNKAKERENAKAREAGAMVDDEAPDFLLACDKQRNGNWEGIWALWGDPKSFHFRESRRQPLERGYKLPELPT